jgi:hypothetical protein
VLQTLGQYNWLGWGIPSKCKWTKTHRRLTNLRVGFYFLLLLLLMYVKRATINIPKRNMIVKASFTSMASPPFEGKPCPPKIQLYFYCTFIFISVQAFLLSCFYWFLMFQLFVTYCLTKVASLSYNVLAFTTRPGLRLLLS